MKLFSDYLDRYITKKVGLVLISSSLILHGCAHHTPEQDPNQDAPQPVVQGGGMHWWYFHSGGYSGGSGGFVPGTPGTSGGVVVSGGGRTSGGFTSSSSVSARGGFGAAGHAFGGSGA